MNSPWPPEELELLLSCYLDGELDLGTRMDLETWLQTHPEGRERLSELRAVATSLADLWPGAEVPAGWTVKAYQIGLPTLPSAPKRILWLGLGQALARPRALGHGLGVRKVLRRWTVALRGATR